MKSILQTKVSYTICAALFIIGMFASVNSNAQCTASFNSVPDSAGSGVNFVSTSTGVSAFTNYTWTFGDGSSGYNSTEYHQYSSSGWYLVCLYINDSLNGCQSSICDSVYAGNGAVFCQSLFTWQPSGLTVAFLNQSTGANLNYHWDFGDGTTAANQNATHTYNQSGQYLVCLTIWNGTCSDTSCNYVTVSSGGACQASFSVYDSAGVYYFINTSTGTSFFTNYYWDFGDNSTGTGLNPTHVYNTMGGFLVCLTISDSAAGCNSTFCDSIWIGGGGGNCQAAFISSPDSAGSGVTFYNNSTGTNSMTDYAWTVSDGYSATGPYFYHVFAAQGWYQVCLNITVYDSLQNILCTSSTCDSLYVGNGGGATCQANWGFQTSNFTCYFGDLSWGTDSLISWMWDFGDSSTSTQQNPVHTYSQSGYYYVCLTIETGSGGVSSCTNTYCQSVYVGNNTTGCQANFTMYPDSAGTGFNFQNLSTGTSSATVYSWSFGDGNYSSLENPFHQYANGYYTVCLTISDSNCSSTYCDSMSVGQSFLCNPYFQWSGDSLNGVQFYEFNNGIANMYYQWTFGDGDSSSQSDPYHIYANAGAYYVCLSVTELDSSGVTICTGSYCDSVYVGAANCAPQIIAMPDSNMWGNGNMSFSVSSPCGNITSATWSYGDGTSGTGSYSTHTYSTSGWFYVCVDVVINGITYTHCDSVFALRLMAIAEVLNPISLVDVFPNPASSSVNISYSLNDAHIVSIRLFDAVGREVKLVNVQKQASGLHHLAIDLKDVSAGIYLLKVDADGSSITKRVAVNK